MTSCTSSSTGKCACLNYDARKTFGISVKQDDEFIGDDIAMLANSDSRVRLTMTWVVSF